MADYDSFDYEINKRMPEWYKHSGLLTPINKYTQELISNLLNGLLTSTGVVQPLNCWLTIPEEYDWFHHYKDTDGYLIDNDGYDVNSLLVQDVPVHAILPNTKRKCHAKIQLKLLGKSDDIPYFLEDDESGNPVYQPSIEGNLDESLINLTLENGTQKIYFKNISKISTIEINTKTNEIFVDGVEGSSLVEGSFNMIEPSPKNSDYQQDDIEDENKETKITLTASRSIDFDLQIKLYKPTYVTEQNIRVASVSAFPIEWVRLYGYFCHPFNNKSGYKFLWEKKYSLDSRTVYDKITKQFDCERFYVEVKFHGIGVPLVKGFPQEELSSELAFQPNPMLDKWGKIYGLPRRYYKENITEEEEPYTFPKYYRYPIEQDYWYEERIINEYRLDDEAINSLLVKDTELNNIMMLNCIYPFMNDIWVYTETINPDTSIKKSFKVTLNTIEQDIESAGLAWESPELIKSNYASKPIDINPQSLDVLKLNDYSCQTKKLLLSFDLEEFKYTTPNEIKITGIKLNIDADTNVQTSLLRLTPDSIMKLPYFTAQGDPIIENLNISGDMPIWNETKLYTIGDSDYLFGEKEISKDQLVNGNNGLLNFEIAFINESDFLKAYLLINSISLEIFYEEIQDDFEIAMFLLNETNTLILDNNERTINLSFHIKNNNTKSISDKQLTVIASQEFSFTNDFNGFSFTLDKNEEFEVNDIELTFNGNRTGKYDILAFCDDKVMKQEIIIRHKSNYIHSKEANND